MSEERARLELVFHDAMLSIYEQARRSCRYNATYFLQMVCEKGGLPTARQLLQTAQPAAGLTELLLCGRLDISVEALVLQKRWRDLFTGEERAIARQRLADLKYSLAEDA